MNTFNLLKDAYSIKNTTTCRYDSLNGYTSLFEVNGDVDGWDIYSSVCLYGVWNSVLFGTTTEKSCFIGRTNPFVRIQAEKYYMLKLTMKITLPDDIKKHEVPTKGKVMWQTVADPTWYDGASKEFDLVLADQWHTYIINMGEAKDWIGYINNLRIFPIIDGFSGINFIIKSIVIDSLSDFVCNNTQCSFYTQYSHPCEGVGTRASITSAPTSQFFTTISGVSDKLIVNIDGYGNEQVALGNNINITGHEMAKVIVDRISRVSYGQYAYAEVVFQEEQKKLTIFSGAQSLDSNITISGTAATVLGFVDDLGNNISTYSSGKIAATGFDFGSSRRLKGFELNALVDSDDDKIAYYHDPNQYSVEAGRRDFFESMDSGHIANADHVEYYKTIDGAQKLIIDASHPVNDSGRLSVIWVNGDYIEYRNKNSTTTSTFIPKVFILRPDKYNNLTIIHEVVIDLEDIDLRYTVDHVTYKVECDLLVNKGDLVGFYNLNVLVPCSSKNGNPNAVYFQVMGGLTGPLTTKFDMGPPMAQGVVGISFYARSNRIQDSIQLDIDIGKRTNIEYLSVYGRENSDSFEYNIASCLDVSWTCDCHNNTHWHRASTSICLTVGVVAYFEHRNKYYGIECLSDCIRTPDGGKEGDSYVIATIGGPPTSLPNSFSHIYNSDPDTYSGIETAGGHAYFYVNGDAEWLNGGCKNSPNNQLFEQAEFKGPWVATSTFSYEMDPISFYLIFPENMELSVYRSIMYFKESQNFKRYSLSYFMGETGPQGNAEEKHFNYVPKYNSITLDGLKLTKENVTSGDDLTQVYDKTLFSNPTPWAYPEYVNGKCINWDIFQTVMATEMNILQHDFDAIKCRGFKIHTTWHKSTKLTELELYSSVPVRPTLLDNVRIQASVYGELWNELSFLEDEINSEKINSRVAGSPRYFKLQLQSQDIFELKEISAVISKQPLKSLGCQDVVSAINAPRGKTTEAQKIEIENTRDINLDLSVTIPTQLFKQNYLLSWIKFDSEATSINGEVGPGALIKKADDFPLLLDEGQVAINTPAYYLKNLIDNKHAYFFTNEHSWTDFGVLEHGVDVECTNVPNGKVTTVGFAPISSKYWKLNTHSPISYSIYNLTPFFNSNTTITPVSPNEIFNLYSEGSYLNSDLWHQQQVIENGKLVISAQGGYSYQRSKFFIDGNFDIEIDYDYKTFPGSTINYFNAPLIKILSANDTGKQVEFNRHINHRYRLQYRTSDGTWTIVETRSTSINGGKMRLVRIGDTFTASFKNSTSYYEVASYTYTGFGNKVYVDLAAYSGGSTNPLVEVYFYYFSLFSGLCYIGDLDSEFLVVTPLIPHKVYIQAPPGQSSGVYEAAFNSSTNDLAPVTLIDDSFSSSDWYTNWEYNLGTTDSNNTFLEKDGELHPFIGPWETIYIEKQFPPGIISFDLEVHFRLDFPNTMEYAIELLNSSDEVVLQMILTGYGNNTAKLNIESPVPLDQEILREIGSVNYNDLIFKDGTFTKETSKYTEGFKFIVKKNYNTLNTIKLQNTSGSTNYYNSTNRGGFVDRVSKLKISYTNLSSDSIFDQKMNFSTNYVGLTLLPKFSDKESIVLEFLDSQPVDAIKIVQPVGDITHMSVAISNFNDNDFIMWARNFIKSSNLTIPHYKIYANCGYYQQYALYSRPWYIFDSDSTLFTGANETTVHTIYDFGEGNHRVLSAMRYQIYYSNPSYTEYTTMQIYGSNEYKAGYDTTASYFSTVRFDFSVATLLSEFTVQYNYDSYMYGREEIFNNNNAYRYYIINFPAIDDENHTIKIRFMQLYEYLPRIFNGLIITNENYINSLAIDLEQIHNLEFLRNYGPIGSPGLLDLLNENYLHYSSTETSNINDVVWKSNIPTLLLHFNKYEDEVTATREISTAGAVSLYSGGGVFAGQAVFGNLNLTTLTPHMTAGHGTAYNYAIANRVFNPVNVPSLTLENKDSAFLEIELKVSVINNIDWGQVEITSNSSSYNTNEWCYPFNSNGDDPLNLIEILNTAGANNWVKVLLPLSDFNTVGADPDPASWRRVRFYTKLKSQAMDVYYRNPKIGFIVPMQGQLNIMYDQSLALANNDFTIDFWFKRSITDVDYEWRISEITGDNFTGSTGEVDPDLWTISKSVSASAEIYNNKARVTIPVSSADESVTLQFKYSLHGDFDIQVDYDEIFEDLPSSSISYPAQLQVYYGDSRAQIGTTWTSSLRRMLVTSTPTNPFIQISTHYPTGKLRITRVGSTLKGYYWTGSQWEWNGNVSGYQFPDTGTEPVSVCITSSADFNGGCTIDWDNFKVNSGDLAYQVPIGTAGILGQVSSHPTTSAFSFMFSSTNNLVASLHVLGGVFVFSSILPVLDSDWHHVALNRNQTSVSFYLDGLAQDGRNIGKDTIINISTEDIVIGTVDSNNFCGTISEFRMLIGESDLKSGFVPPIVEYSIDTTLGDKTNARWVKIDLLCGDGNDRALQYVGIYPDIRYPFILSGGNNCEWISLGNRLSDYENISRNLAINASIIGDDYIKENFENDLSDEWSNLINTTSNINVSHTDFGGTHPDSFWASYYNNFNTSGSFIKHENNKLKVYFSDTENNDCGFNTPSFISTDCTCEVRFKLSHTSRVARFWVGLRVYAENGDWLDVRLHIYAGIQWRVDYGNVGGGSSYYSYGSFAGELIGLKLKRVNSTIYSYYLDDNGWHQVPTTRTVDHFSAQEIYFMLWLSKEQAYPEIEVEVDYIRVTEVIDETITTIWDTTVSGFEGNALSYHTPEFMLDEGPIFSPEILSAGTQIQFFEYYYYNTGVGGAGFSIEDNEGNEIIGVATTSPGWAISSANIGWENVNSAPVSGNSGWYRVKLTFDWQNGLCDIDWEDISGGYTNTYSKELKYNTNVKSFHIRSTFGNAWGLDFINVIFDKITIMPLLTHLLDFERSNCISGNIEATGLESSWGWPSSEKSPTLLLDLGEIYSVDNFKIYHRPEPSDFSSYMNYNYTISSATSISGTFETLFNITGHSESEWSPYQTSYVLDEPKDMRIVRLVITSYKVPDNIPVIRKYNRDGTSELIKVDGGFLREFEVWTSVGQDPVNSEDHPIICMDLLDQFNLTNHALVGPQEARKDADRDAKLWSNNNDFFQYADSNTLDPHQVAFSETNDYSYPFQYVEELMIDDGSNGPFSLGSTTFLPSGNYVVKWNVFNSLEPGDISISIIGHTIIKVSSEGVSTSWIQQSSNFRLETAGYFTVQLEANRTGTENWAVKEIYFQSYMTTSRWVALRRNTATNFEWTQGAPYDTSLDNHEGVDYLSYLSLYSADKHPPTEYSHWWTSVISTLSTDSLNLKKYKRSLRIDYPDSYTEDNIRFLEGDCFGLDSSFSIKDALHVWFFINDVNKLDLDYGGIAFGVFTSYVKPNLLWETTHNSASYFALPGELEKKHAGYVDHSATSPGVYMWWFKDMDLKSGWNQLKLRFDKYNSVIPLPEENTGKLSSALNFRNHLMSSFGIVCRGKGEAFYMLLDDLRIERNYYYDEVMYGNKGLCLTWEDYAEIPLSGIDTMKGTISMWLKLYSSTAGIDHFNDLASRTLFTLIDTGNTSISLSIRSGSWFEIGVGNTKSGYVPLHIDTTKVAVGEAAFNIDEKVHLALTWSKDSSGFDNKDTIRLYVNGELYFRSSISWEQGDSKNVLLRLGGGNTYLANNDDTDGSAIFSDVKFYNYCKTEFNINELSPEKELSTVVPNDLVQLSMNNETFYSSRDQELPFEFKEVNPGEIIPVYVRVDKSNMDKLDKVTGSITVEWKVPV